MSKFWQNAQSSDSESEASSVSEEEVKVPKPTGGKFGMFGPQSDSESEDDGNRVVKSQKDRMWDNVKESVRKIRNSMKTGDWPIVQGEFEELNKKIDKSKILINQHGIPKCYIMVLSDVADSLAEALKDKEGIKKLKPAVTKALNQMKLKVRKHNEKYKDQIADCKENPQNYESEAEEEDDEDEDESEDESEDSDEDSDEDNSDEDGSSENSESEDDDESDDDSDDDGKAKAKPKAASKFNASDDDSDFEDDLASEVSDAEIQTIGEFKLTGRLRWMKTEALIKLMPHLEPYLSKKKGNEIKRTVKKVSIKRETKFDPEKEARRSTVSSSAWIIDKNVTEEVLDKKLKEIIGSRGRRGTNVKDTVRALEVLAKAARQHGPRKEIPVLMFLIASFLDSQKSIDEYMELLDWRTTFRYMTRIVGILEKNKSLVLGAMDEEDITDAVASVAKKGSEETKEESSKPIIDTATSGPIKIVGSLESFLSRMEEEYNKSLQQINPHTQEYVTRLADEASLIELSEQIFSYYSRVKDYSAASCAALLHLEHVYYKHDSIAAAVHRAHHFTKKFGYYSNLHPASLGHAATAIPEVDGSFDVTKFHPGSFSGLPNVIPPPNNPSSKLEELSHFIYKHGDDRSKARALLCSVYHHALHDNFFAARDIFLISHIQDTVDKMDIKTQILYNRALVSLGLCAFRLGHLSKAHDCLSGICTGKMKELLAQGQKFFLEKDREQEKMERRRQLPYHMHINPDLLECCHLISAMLLELPSIARTNGSLTIQPTVSRQFRKYFHAYSRQVFTGPPENTREHILSAAQALLNGEWKRATDLIVNLESWNLLPGDGPDKVKALLKSRVKEEGVRVYLLTYGEYFESIYLSHICELFEMDETAARKIISGMIFNREISAAWEHPADTLLLYKVDPSNIQTLSTTIAEKVTSLMESNERLIDPFIGTYGYKEEVSHGRDGRGGQGRQSSTDDKLQNRKQQWKQGMSRASHPRMLPGRSRRNVSGQGGQVKSNVWAGGKKQSDDRGSRSSQQGGNQGPMIA